MIRHEADNNSLAEHLKKPRDDWVSCRWINVNGLSWDVIKQLGNHKSLHRLAIEDLLNTSSQPKADWYSDHAYSTFNFPFTCFPSRTCIVGKLKRFVELISVYYTLNKLI